MKRSSESGPLVLCALWSSTVPASISHKPIPTHRVQGLSQPGVGNCPGRTDLIKMGSLTSDKVSHIILTLFDTCSCLVRKKAVIPRYRRSCGYYYSPPTPGTSLYFTIHLSPCSSPRPPYFPSRPFQHRTHHSSGHRLKLPSSVPPTKSHVDYHEGDSILPVPSTSTKEKVELRTEVTKMEVAEMSLPRWPLCLLRS